MTLEAWRDSRFIVEYEPHRQEILDLLGIVTTDLNDARIDAVSADRRLACCYSAVLSAARAALRAAGYRVPKGTNHHYYAIQSLRFTVGVDRQTLHKIESMGKKRAMADYVRVGEVSASMVKDAIAFAEGICEQTIGWIRAHDPDWFQS